MNVVVAGPEVRPQLGGDRAAEIVEGRRHAIELHRVEVAEDRPEAILLDGLHGIEGLETAGGERRLPAPSIAPGGAASAAGGSA